MVTITALSAVLAPDGKCKHSCSQHSLGIWLPHVVFQCVRRCFRVQSLRLKKGKKRTLLGDLTTYLESGICFNHFFCLVCRSLFLFLVPFCFFFLMVTRHAAVIEVFVLFCFAVGLYVGSNWNVNDWQMSNVLLECMCNVSFIDRRSEWSERWIKEGFNFFLFSLFFLLRRSHLLVTEELVNDSISCDETSDLTKMKNKKGPALFSFYCLVWIFQRRPTVSITLLIAFYTNGSTTMVTLMSAPHHTTQSRFLISKVPLSLHRQRKINSLDAGYKVASLYMSECMVWNSASFLFICLFPAAIMSNCRWMCAFWI